SVALIVLIIIVVSFTTFFVRSYRDLRDLHSFPTRRSSDLRVERVAHAEEERPADDREALIRGVEVRLDAVAVRQFEPDGEQSRLTRVAPEHGHLGAGGEDRRSGTPLERGCV